jgi:hypothetical protein
VKIDGTTDNATALQAEANALTSGGILIFPIGTTCIKTQLSIVIPGFYLVGQSNQGSVLSACGANASLIYANAARIHIERLFLQGFNSLFATNPTVNLAADCVECIISDAEIVYGSQAVLANAVDFQLRDVKAYDTYGDSIVKVIGEGGYIERAKLDHPYPVSIPSAVSLPRMPPWEAAHAYKVDDIASNAGFYIQCSKAGTSAGSAPVNQTYGATITDGTAQWLLMAPTSYRGIIHSQKTSFLYVTDTDITGAMQDGILQQGALLSVIHGTFGAEWGTGINVFAGSDLQIGGMTQFSNGVSTMISMPTSSALPGRRSSSARR